MDHPIWGSWGSNMAARITGGIHHRGQPRQAAAQTGGGGNGQDAMPPYPPTPVLGAFATGQEVVLLQEAVLQAVVLRVRSLKVHLQTDPGNERSAVESENSERRRICVKSQTAFLAENSPLFARKSRGP